MREQNAEDMTAVQKLRSMLADPGKLIVCPGVYDGFTARLALAEGAECLYMVRHCQPILPISTPTHQLTPTPRPAPEPQCLALAWPTWASQL